LIEKDKPLIVAAITTTFAEPPPSNHMKLPWHPRGSVSTKLRQRSAVVLDWQSTITPDEVVAFGGDVPIRTMLEIELRLDDLTSGE
jgi:hypothetical protein